jgi:hypothetical protein
MSRVLPIPSRSQEVKDLIGCFIEEELELRVIPNLTPNLIRELKNFQRHDPSVSPIKELLLTCPGQLDNIHASFDIIIDVENLSAVFNDEIIGIRGERRERLQVLCFLIHFIYIFLYYYKNSNIEKKRFIFVFRYNHYYEQITKFLNNIFEKLDKGRTNKIQKEYYRAFLLGEGGVALKNIALVNTDVLHNLNFNSVDIKNIDEFFHDCCQIDDYFILYLASQNINNIIISRDNYRDNNITSSRYCTEYHNLRKEILPCILIDASDNTVALNEQYNIFWEKNIYGFNGFMHIIERGIKYNFNPNNNFELFFNKYLDIAKCGNPYRDTGSQIKRLHNRNLPTDLVFNGGRITYWTPSRVDTYLNILEKNCTASPPLFKRPRYVGGEYYNKYLKYKAKYLELKKLTTK